MYKKAVVFDLDGTLLDSMWIWTKLGADYLKSKGKIPSSNLLSKIEKMNMQESAQYFKTHYRINEDEDKIINSLNGILQNYYKNICNLKEGAFKFIEKLYSKEIPMLIATSTDRVLVELALKRSNIDKYIQKIFTSTELSTNKKSSKIYDECAKYLKCKPKDITVFEDVLFAIKTAKDAGYHVIAVEDSFSNKEKFEISKIADRYITSFNELL